MNAMPLVITALVVFALAYRFYFDPHFAWGKREETLTKRTNISPPSVFSPRAKFMLLMSEALL